MFKNSIQLKILTVLLFICASGIIFFWLNKDNSIVNKKFTNYPINKEKTSQFIESDPIVILEKYDLRFGYVVNMYLKRISNKNIKINDQQLAEVNLEFILNVNNKSKQLNVSVVKPFWGTKNTLIYPENASDIFQKGKYYNLTFLGFSNDLTSDEYIEYCQSGENLKVSTLEECLAQAKLIDNGAIDKISEFILNDQSQLSIDSLWLLKAEDQLEIDLSDSVQQ